MPNANKIEDYLIGNEKSFLLNSDNNGKVIMISGKWGCGKTCFWQETIMKKLKNEHVYISLYGKNSIESIQNEVLLKIYNRGTKKEKTDKIISVFSSILKNSSINIPIVNLNGNILGEYIDKCRNNKIESKARKIISDGGIICFDDFERKSTKIDLNDLFGFITQLALELKCKVVVILNEEYFESKDADTFSRVKEKTVNKFISFEPTKSELFELIYNSNKKYEYFNGSPKEIVLKSIEEADELNARIYIQILDNCLEYMKSKRGGSSSQIRTLVLATIIFTKYNKNFNPIFNKPIGYPRSMQKYLQLRIDELINLPDFLDESFDCILPGNDIVNEVSFYEKMKKYLSDFKKTIQNGTAQLATPNKILEQYFDSFEKNKKLLWLIYFYAYKLDFRKDVTDDDLKEINNFVKNGII